MKAELDFRLLGRVSAELWDNGERLLQAYRTAETDDAHLSELLEWGGFAEFSTILDMGCGFGELAWSAEKHRPDLAVVSINLSAEQLAHAPYPKLYADFTDTGLESGRYGGAVFAYSIGHADPRRALEEAYRLLYRGGVLLIWDLEGPTEGLHSLAYEPFALHEALALEVGFTLHKRLTFEKRPRHQELNEYFDPYTPVLWVYKR